MHTDLKEPTLGRQSVSAFSLALGFDKSKPSPCQSLRLLHK